MNTALDVIAFLDKRQNGRYPVFDTDGRPLAFVTVPWSGRRFTAVTADERPLCSGAPRWFDSRYDVLDADGGSLLVVCPAFWNGKKRTVALPSGAELELRGESWPSRDWNVSDAAGRTVLSIAATASSWSFHPDAYAVQVGDPQLTLAHVVGIVQANRILVKAARARARSSSS